MTKYFSKQALSFQIVAFVALLLFLSVVLNSCTDKCETVVKYTYFEPVYASMTDVRNSFATEAPRDLEVPGKIYIYGDYLLVGDAGKGIHIYDNRNVKSPQPLAFVNIPGNFDMAVKENILYADSYVDLVAIDIGDINNIKLVDRIEDAFPLFNTVRGFAASDGMVITDWVEKEAVDINEDCSGGFGGVVFFAGGVAVAEAASFDAMRNNSGNNSSPQGIAGSMARFAIYEQNLYAVDFSTMHVFDVATAENPIKASTVDLPWGIETIFPYEDFLFIGAQNGMHIYDNQNPAEPTFRSTFQHATTCDPVIVDGELAYITLRSGNECQGFTNQLDVIDISNIDNPTLVSTYPMQNPHGLGKDGDLLFITEGDFGLKVFDANDPNAISSNLVFEQNDIHGFDVIPFNNVLILIGEDGLHQFNYIDPTNITLCSTIPIVGAQ